MQDHHFSICFVIPDESTGRLFMDKIKSYFQKINLDLGLFGEAKPALLYIERHNPSIIIASEQIPGMKWQEFIKAVEKYSSHSLIIRLNNQIEGIQLINGSHIVDLGIPVLEWEKVMILIEEEIPTEVKFRFGMERRESSLLKKLRAHSLNYNVSSPKHSVAVSFLPPDFESTDIDQSVDLKEEVIRNNEDIIESQINYSFPISRKEEWVILFLSFGLALLFHLPWAEKGNWELVRWFFNFIFAVSLIGFLLKPFSQQDK
jgi:hypothetical protein